MSSTANKMRTVRVFVVDDSPIFLQALTKSLHRFQQVVLVGSAYSADAALPIIQKELPDLVLVDVKMPDVDGKELTRLISEESPGVDCLALSVSDDESDLLGMIRAGARGYVLKTASIEEIVTAILAVARGESWLSPKMASKLISEFTTFPASDSRSAVARRYSRLTPRELAVLRQLTLGRTNKEISGILDIAETTVKTHLKNILEKLHARNRLQAALLAMHEEKANLEAGPQP